MEHRSLIQSPEALSRVCRGFDELATLLALTLGPTQGTIVSDVRGKPEVLTDAGTIARRVIELPRRGEDAGAMILRNMVWQMRERYGDGAATASVLAQAMVREAAPLIAAGAHSMLIRRGIEHGVRAACESLMTQAQAISGQAMFTQLATSITGDPDIGALLGEMFDVLGPHAALVIEEYAAPYLDHEYIDGGRWQTRLAARGLLPEGQRELTLHRPLVVLVDQELESVAQLRPALEYAATLVENGMKAPLLIVARAISGAALDTVVLNHARGALIIGAAIPSTGSALSDDLSDIALLTGGDVIADVLGRSPQRLQQLWLGRARQVRLQRDSLTIVGGTGDRRLIRERVAQLRTRTEQLQRTDHEWERLRLRSARLAGGVGIVKVGAHTEREREQRKEQIKKAVRALDAARETGVVTGGGTAYLACRPAVLAARARCTDVDEARGADAVAAALAAPFSCIVGNHGVIYPPIALAEAQRGGPAYGFDTQTGTYTCMQARGILDSVGVLRGALEAAASAAVMVLTTDVIVLPPDHRRERKLTP